MADKTLQYIRTCSLLVVDTGSVATATTPAGTVTGSQAIDLSNLHIKFSIKNSDAMTPNISDIRVYNMDSITAAHIKALERNGRGKVILQGGYPGNIGVIFQGNIKQVIIGRESGVDNYVEIIAGDGQRAYNYGIVNQTLAAGATQTDQVTAVTAPMGAFGVTKGNLGDMPTTQLPRGKVMFGNSINYLRNTAHTTKQTWSIQNGLVTFIPNQGYLPGTAIEINSSNGMIGSPAQTTIGVNVKCLINPSIKIGTRVKLNNSQIQALPINLNVTTPDQLAQSVPAALNPDGMYYVLVMEHAGDTRGTDWYTTLTCLNIDVSANPRNAVQIGYGGV